MKIDLHGINLNKVNPRSPKKKLNLKLMNEIMLEKTKITKLQMKLEMNY